MQSRPKVLAGERERLGQVCATFLAGLRAAGVHLEHHHAGVAAGPQAGQERRARLGTAAGDQVLVGQARARAVGHGHRVRPGHGGVREVERGVRAVDLDRVPVRRVRGHLGGPRPERIRAQRIEVLNREFDVGLGVQLGKARLEVPGVLALPAERRVHHDHFRAELLRHLPGTVQLAPWLASPDPLGDHQAGSVHGEDRDAVVVREPAQDIQILADRVHGDHDFDAVKAKSRRCLESVRRPLGIDRGRGQRHLHTRRRGDLAQGISSAAGWVISGCCARASRAASLCRQDTLLAPGSGCRCLPLRCHAWESPRLRQRSTSARNAAGRPLGGWAGRKGLAGPPTTTAVPIAEVDATAARARPTGLGELDRVLGGGLVPGAVVLLAGEPGVGKSTLLLEAGALAAGSGRVLYVTGEESAAQVRMRADRVGAIRQNLFLAAETDMGALLEHVEAVQPGLLIVDSVQTISVEGVEGVPGGVTQIREVTGALTALAKQRTLTTVLVGHVTKDGSIAGPRSLEHLVDVVLHFDGDRHAQLRMVRALKNRFGPTDEIGCFELGEVGLTELPDPSGLFLSRLSEPVPGTCVTVTLEGRRPLVAEVQTLICEAVSDPVQRRTSGLDSSRVAMLVAVLQARANMGIGKKDVYSATVGGVRLTEPSVDLAIALSLASALSKLNLPAGLIAIGEVGLAGEIRRVTGVQRRLAEAARMGFRQAIVPPGSPGLPPGEDSAMVVTEAAHIRQAIAIALGTGAGDG